MTNLETLLAPPKKTASKHEFTEEQLALAKEVVEGLIEAKCVLSWGRASRTFLEKNYRPAYTSWLVALFNKVEPGSDALLVAADGGQSEKVAPRHSAWRAGKDFPESPEIL